MAYTDRQLKNATQIAYADFSKLIAELPARKEPYTIAELMSELSKRPNFQGSFSAMRDFMNSADQTDWNQIKNWKIIATHDTNAKNGFYGCVIDTGNGNAIVGLRGSEAMDEMGNLVNDWVKADLGLLPSTLTEQQAEMERFLKDISESGYIKNYGNLAITGHSLGGNLAEHGMIMADKYGLDRLLSQCVSFDGPGFSQEYIMEHYTRINEIAGQMKHFQWSLVGNLLQMLPGVDVNSLKTHESDDFAYNLIGKHATTSIMFDEYGNAIQGEQDMFSAAVGLFSRGIDHMPKIVGDVLVASISVLLISVSWAADKMFDDNGLTPFGWTVVIGAVGLVAVIGIGPIIAFVATVLIIAVVAVAAVMLVELVYEGLVWLVERAIDLAVAAWNWSVQQIANLRQFIQDVLAAAKNWWNNNLNLGYMYARDNPAIRIDTTKLRNFASELRNLNSKLASIDRRMDSIYWHLISLDDLVGSGVNLWRLFRADILTGYSIRMNGCVGYLETTADAFESAERDIRGNLVKN
jgi:hypothetical protein